MKSNSYRWRQAVLFAIAALFLAVLSSCRRDGERTAVKAPLTQSQEGQCWTLEGVYGTRAVVSCDDSPFATYDDLCTMNTLLKEPSGEVQFTTRFFESVPRGHWDYRFPNTWTYVGKLLIEDENGTLIADDLGTFNLVHEDFGGMANIYAGTGLYEGAYGVLRYHGGRDTTTRKPFLLRVCGIN